MHTTMQTGPQMAPAFFGFFFLIWLAIVGGMIIGWIIFLVAVWRGMKAHESIARSVERIADRSVSPPGV